MEIHLLGIRHHGTGSARNVLESLQTLQPDIILVEGPPELDAVTPWVADKQLKPPVAVLGYNPDKPSQAVFYPFAEFSPEWQAMGYAFQHQIPVRMTDLPLAHSFGIALKKQEENPPQPDSSEPDTTLDLPPALAADPESTDPAFAGDPLSHLARLAGYPESEPWWEQHFEQNYLKGFSQEHFEAVLLAMTALREHLPAASSERDDLREAYMRKIIRQAQKDGFQKAVIVCGAWHAPVLTSEMIEKTAKTDEKLLAKLPSTKVACTWIPWTNTRLGMFTGYGAGIVSPGWYAHRWKYPADKGIRWLTNVARLFRNKQMDTSTAHVIEAYRLAEALAAMRELARPGLNELNEATQTVICFGDSVLLKLVQEELIVGKSVIGKVPQALPRLPIQNDFDGFVKKLKLKKTEATTELELDIRNQNNKIDFDRSVFFHRLELLDIKWANKKDRRKGGSLQKGTSREWWDLKWQPEIEIDLIEKGFWGNSIEEAAIHFVSDSLLKAKSVTELVGFLEQLRLSNLLETAARLLDKLDELATVASDTAELLEAFARLNSRRQEDARQIDLDKLKTIKTKLLLKICISLPNACYGLSEENAAVMFDRIKKADENIRESQAEDWQADWYKALSLVLDKPGVSLLITGCTTRLLFDGKIIDAAQTAQRFGLALSAGNEPKDAAAWIEGFLKGSGMILLLDNALWNILYQWVSSLETENFTLLLPLLRRTFARFDPAERKQLGEKAKKGLAAAYATVPLATTMAEEESFDAERAAQSLGVLKLILQLS